MHGLPVINFPTRVQNQSIPQTQGMASPWSIIPGGLDPSGKCISNLLVPLSVCLARLSWAIMEETRKADRRRQIWNAMGRERGVYINSMYKTKR